MSNVRVVGTGITLFGNVPERTGRDLFAEASIAAFEDSGVPRDDVEAVFYGNFMGELAEHQGHQGPLMAEAAGVRAPATRYESACASSGVAVRDAVHRIRAEKRTSSSSGCRADDEPRQRARRRRLRSPPTTSGRSGLG